MSRDFSIIQLPQAHLNQHEAKKTNSLIQRCYIESGHSNPRRGSSKHVVYSIRSRSLMLDSQTNRLAYPILCTRSISNSLPCVLHISHGLLFATRHVEIRL